ncbi:OmpA family protein [Galbibacter sp. EGI 63066]|uniref:OmpA family protein n=1 Tax=Galbibacter sp. EGI 63066 TaxID=2993559 RepID=UPI0022496989|nr:OmpA family protein [Galbibacter sp. EGI 63066]MCX2678696.1 OmpA family protein [Galbibacter sp. EGI 63066]
MVCKSYIKGWLIMMCMLLVCTVIAQEQKLNRAEKEYSRLGFIKASDIYEKVANKGYKSAELFKKLGNTYYFNAKYEEAGKWYEQLFELEEDVNFIYYLRYSQCLKVTGNDKKARKYYDLFMKKGGVMNKDFTSSANYLDIIEKHSNRYTITNLPVNTDGIDFGSTVYDGYLIFASTRDTGTVIKRKSAWDGHTFLDIYKTPVDSVEKKNIKKIKGEVNTRFHESSVAITKDDKTMYFTRNNTTPQNLTGKLQTQHLKIYRATNIDGKWVNVEDLSINGDRFSTAHPVLSPTEDKLYFVSDRPESLGATDIFMAEIHSDGTLGRAENLGEKVNTRGKESFPFVTERGELYFSSDGHFGLGGYDVFYVILKNDMPTGSLINVGTPVNSEFDDFAFSIDTGTHKGFISSNRTGGKGYDDIYAFLEQKDIRELLKARIYGKVIDKNTREPLAATTIIFFTDEGKAIEIHTDNEGRYDQETDRYQIYRLRAEKENFSTDEAISQKDVPEQEINFELQRDRFPITEGLDLAEYLGIKDIYFDFDKWNIRPDAEVDLQKVLVVLQQFPDMKISIHSHTDSRGNDAYNMQLSDKRAKATMQYLIDKGIAPERLSAKGYGETQLLNDCGNGVKCSKEEHQLNRRSEFIIIK